MDKAIKATREPGSRRISFSGLPEIIEGIPGYRDEMEIEVRYMGISCGYNGVTLDNAVIPTIVQAVNEYAAMKAALARALEFMERVEAKEWNDGGAETMPEVEELREFIKSID